MISIEVFMIVVVVFYFLGFVIGAILGGIWATSKIAKKQVDIKVRDKDDFF